MTQSDHVQTHVAGPFVPSAGTGFALKSGMTAHSYTCCARLTGFAGAALLVGACSSQTSLGDRADSAASSTPPSTRAASGPCDPDNGGITVPPGFCASVFADNLGHARHLVVAANGDVYVNTWMTDRNKTPNPPGGFVVALRDINRDGHADQIERFGAIGVPGQNGGGTGIAIHNDWLFVEVDDRIVRYQLTGAGLVPVIQAEPVLSGLPREGDHQMHPFAISNDGKLFVNSGSMTNSCQEKNRTLESPGQKPCAELATHAGIWRYSATHQGQTFSARQRYATGMRNTVALDVHPLENQLYAVVHGRDQLSENWPRLYSAAQNTELPAEVLVRVATDRDYGWPRCYFDGARDAYFLAPEYGGDGGKAVGSCASTERPLMVFPAHWAPESIAFTGTGPSDEYSNGAFIAFHGSWNREPVQSGFLVAFMPFAGGRPAGRYVEFATGFAGASMPAKPELAAHRPVGVAVGPDGALYVSDDVTGRIWRIAKVPTGSR
jgi:glucose/arabinose dehydrogenase